MKWYLNNADITDKVNEFSCIHEMRCGDRADSLHASFTGPDLWETWNPEVGASIRRKDGKADTGLMYISKITAERDFFRINAMSKPPGAGGRKNRSWDGCRFLQIAGQAASSSGLELKNIGCKNWLYRHIEQEGESDLAFLRRVCLLEGYQMMAYDGNLIVYDACKLESESMGELVLDEDDEYSIEDGSGGMYSSCIVTCGKYKGKYTASGGNGRIYRPEIPISAGSDAEAARFAKGLLRRANELKRAGSAAFPEIRAEYGAGSVLDLSVEGRPSRSGRIIIYYVLHDYVGEKTTIFFRYALEGY